MASKDAVLTKDGKKKLEEELKYLENDKRSEVSARIKEARGFGDLSENSEYDDAKNEQAMVEKRIAEIHDILINAKVVRSQNAKGVVGIGSVVIVNMGGNKKEFKIVGGAESDIANNKISNESPVGIALIGNKKGDTVNAQGPTGKKIKIEILEVS